MIAVDTNVIAYLIVGGERTDTARAVFRADAVWAAPVLWRSEFRSVLTNYVRAQHLRLADAQELFEQAADLMTVAEYEPAASRVLRLAASSGCSAYDCEFIAVAEQLGVRLVTEDRQVLAAFPSVTSSMAEFVGSTG